MVGCVESHVGVLFYQQDRFALPVDLVDDIEHVLDHDRRKAQRRLIHHDDLRTAHKSAGDCQHLLLAARECTGQLPRSFFKTWEQVVAPVDIVVQTIFS